MKRRTKPNPDLLRRAALSRAIRADVFAKDAPVLSVGDVLQLVDAYQAGHLRVAPDGTVTIATPGTAVKGIVWQPGPFAERQEGAGQ